MQFISDFFAWLEATYYEFLQWIWDTIGKVFETGWLWITDAAVWVFESALEVAVGAVGLLEIPPELLASSSYWGTLPGDVLNIMGLIRIPEAIGIIVAAILIKIVLQLVPFTRLGS